MGPREMDMWVRGYMLFVGISHLCIFTYVPNGVFQCLGNVREVLVIIYHWMSVLETPIFVGTNFFLLSFFRSSLRDSISCPLWGNVVPIPEQRLWGH